jgi:hypothetical protein
LGTVLVAAAVCPHPPLLVPGVGSGASAELDGLRTACDAALAALLQVQPDAIVAVGAAPQVGAFPADARAALAGYGLDITVGPGLGPPDLPLPLTLARWLLERAGPLPPYTLFGIPADAAPQRCRDLGAALVERSRVALLVMGDASARRSLKGPGYLDPRAEGFDAGVESALAEGDVAALLALDVGLADDLLVAGRAAWQVLAGAAGEAQWAGDVLFSSAPYGVAYLVATWLPAGG